MQRLFPLIRKTVDSTRLVSTLLPHLSRGLHDDSDVWAKKEAREQWRNILDVPMPSLEEDSFHLLQPTPRRRSQKWAYADSEQVDFVDFVDFRFLESWEEVRNVVASIGSSFTQYHAAAAFARLRYLPRPVDSQLLNDLVEKTRPLIPSMTPHQLMSIIFSVLRMEMIAGLDFLEDFAQRLMQMDGTPRATGDVTKLMFGIGLGKRHISWSLGALEHQYFCVFPSETKLMIYLRDILKNDKERLEQLTEVECAHVLFALSQYRAASDGEEELLQHVCDLLSSPVAIKQLSETYHVFVITSLAALNLQHRLLIDRLLEENIRSGALKTYMAQEIVTILFCLGSLRHWNRGVTETLVSEILKPHHLSSLTEQGVANAICGIARMGEMKGLDKERYVLPLFIEAAKPERLARYIGIGLTGILYTAGLMAFPSGKHRNHLIPFLEELVAPERIGTTPTQGLAMALWGMGKVGLKTGRYIDLLLEESLKPWRLQSMKNQGVGLLAYSCGLLKHRNAHMMQKIVSEANRPGRLQSLTNRDISHLAYGIGRTNCVPIAMAFPLIKETVKRERLVTMDSKHICQVLHVATLLDHRHMEDLRILLEELHKEERRVKMGPIEIQEVLICCGRRVELIQCSEARTMLYTALSEEILQQSKAAQLRSLGNFMSMHLPLLNIRPEDSARYANEVTKAERLAEFNPVDLTGIYTTLIRLDVREEEKLMSILEAVEKKPLSPVREAIQFVKAMISTNRIEEMPLHGRLLERLLQHCLLPSNLSLFQAPDAFAMVMALLESRPSPEFHPKWQEALCTFERNAKKGPLSNISMMHLMRCLRHFVNRQDELSAQTDILSWLLPEIFEERRIRSTLDELLVELAENVSQATKASPVKQSEALASLHMLMEQTDRLKKLSEIDTAKLESLFQQFAPNLTLSDGKSVRTTASYSYESHSVARNLERMAGYVDD